ncbi:MAG: protein kinase [Cyanobacteria bacterium HKST-UBA02]|nr:protein kinase [Cyanobacteria bacterium HKST-UBA02]
MTASDNIRIPERFTLIRKLGEGGMGAVLLCHDTVLLREVAIKVLLSCDSPDEIRRFQNEAKIVARLSHPNIIQVLDFGQSEDGSLYLVLEYVEGESLARILARENTLSVEDTLPLLRQICQGLAYAHDNGVWHRDIKPSNVMVLQAEDGVTLVKLVDFGIARSNFDESQRLTMTGAAVGSPLYISPEGSRGEDTDARSDIYSLGCLIFQVLTGSVPFKGETAVATIMMHANEPPPALSDRAESGHEFPELLEGIVGRCLEKDPADRFQTIAELEEALDELEELLAPRPVQTPVVSMKKAVLPALVFVVIVAVIVVTGILFGSGTALRESKKKSREIKQDSLILLADPEGDDEFKTSFIDRGREVTGNGTVDSDLQDLRGRTDIRQLNLRNGDFDGSGFRYISDLPLRTLDLTSSYIKPAGLEEISKIKSLEILFLKGVKGMEGGCRYLGDLPALTALSLKTSCATNDDVISLGGCRALTVLDLQGCRHITGDGFSALSAIPGLKILMLSNSGFKRANMKELTGMKRLEALRLASLSLEDRDIEPLLGFKLRSLDLSGNPDLTVEGIEKLLRVKTLRRLFVSREQLKIIPQFKKRLPGCKVSADAPAAYQMNKEQDF